MPACWKMQRSYSDVRSALTDAVTNIVQNNADIDSEMQNAQDTVEFNIAG